MGDLENGEAEAAKDWMKMATDNVRFEAHPRLTISLIHPRRKSMRRTRGILR
jgi:hypothetical protein